MNRTNIISIIIAITALAMASALLIMNTGKKDKIAYVDSMKLLSKYEGVKEVSTELEKKTKVWQANVDTLENELQVELKKYENGRAKMNDKEKRAEEELLQNKQQQYQQYRSAMENKAKEENEKLSARPLEKLNDYIKEYGKRHDYKIIFGANQTGNVLYALDALNITDDVIQGANDEYKKGK